MTNITLIHKQKIQTYCYTCTLYIHVHTQVIRCMPIHLHVHCKSVMYTCMYMYSCIHVYTCTCTQVLINTTRVH